MSRIIVPTVYGGILNRFGLCLGWFYSQKNQGTQSTCLNHRIVRPLQPSGMETQR